MSPMSRARRTGKLDFSSSCRGLAVRGLDAAIRLDNLINALLGVALVISRWRNFRWCRRWPGGSLLPGARFGSPSITPSCSFWRRSVSGSCAPRPHLRLLQPFRHRPLPGCHLHGALQGVFSWVIPVIIVANIPARILVRGWTGRGCSYSNCRSPRFSSCAARACLEGGAEPVFQRQLVSRCGD